MSKLPEPNCFTPPAALMIPPANNIEGANIDNPVPSASRTLPRFFDPFVLPATTPFVPPAPYIAVCLFNCSVCAAYFFVNAKSFCRAATNLSACATDFEIEAVSLFCALAALTAYCSARDCAVATLASPSA